MGLYLTANSNVSIERFEVVTLDADRSAAGSPSIKNVPVSHALCALHPVVLHLHGLVYAVVSLDLRSTFLDSSVKQAMSFAYCRVSRFTT